MNYIIRHQAQCGVFFLHCWLIFSSLLILYLSIYISLSGSCFAITLSIMQLSYLILFALGSAVKGASLMEALASQNTTLSTLNCTYLTH
jgi:hypothetical protein